MEERILELQEWKRGMVGSIMGESALATAPSASLKRQDVEYLLGQRTTLLAEDRGIEP